MACRKLANWIIALAIGCTGTSTAYGTLCFGEDFQVRILVESCDPEEISHQYTLRVHAKTLERTDRDIVPSTEIKTIEFTPGEVAPVGHRRVYLIPTGKGYEPAPKKILSCEDVVAREFMFGTGTCHCLAPPEKQIFKWPSAGNCEELQVNPPATWWEKWRRKRQRYASGEIENGRPAQFHIALSCHVDP